jgi:hypothetical protein
LGVPPAPVLRELKTESCFLHALLRHFGQSSGSVADRTITSKR